MKEREIVITDNYKFNEHPYQNGEYIGVGNPKALWKEVSRNSPSKVKLDKDKFYKYVKGECDREYGFYYKPKDK